MGGGLQMCLKFHPPNTSGNREASPIFSTRMVPPSPAPGQIIYIYIFIDAMNWVWTIPCQFSRGGLLRFFVLEREKKLGEPWKILMVFQLPWWKLFFLGAVVLTPIRYVEFYILLEGAHFVGVFVFWFMTNSCRGYVESPQAQFICA